MQVAVDPAELLGCLTHPGGDPAQHHLAVLPAFDIAGVVAAALDHRLDGVGGSQRSSKSGWHAKPSDGEGLGQPSRSEAATPGWERSSSRASASSSAWATSGSVWW